MSASVIVFIRSTNIPTMEAWNAAIKAEGFDLVLETFDLELDSGYRPATLLSEESGFEWYFSPATSFTKDTEFPYKDQLGESDAAAQLCYGSRGDEATAAAIAGAVLAKTTGGYFWAPSENSKLLCDDNAIAFSRITLQQWLQRSTNPAKYIANAINQILLPALVPLGFTKVGPRSFARLAGDIIQEFGVEKHDTDFRAGGTGVALYPVREFLPGVYFPRKLEQFREASTQDQANSSMGELVAAFMDTLYPWFEETKTVSGILDYLMEFSRVDCHTLLDRACLLAKLERMEEATHCASLARRQYEENEREWSAVYIGYCDKLLEAIRAGQTLLLLEDWKNESLRNLKMTKLRPQSGVTEKVLAAAVLHSPQIPPPLPGSIPSNDFSTAALFSRDMVRPAVAAMVQKVLPEFSLAADQGYETIYRSGGKGGLYYYIVFKRRWSGTLAVQLAANYDSMWSAIPHSKLGCCIDLGDWRTGRWCHSSPETLYHYGKSSLELSRQLLILAGHLAQYARPYFAAAQDHLLSLKLLQFGLRCVAKRPMTESEKFLLRKEYGATFSKVGLRVANPRFVELHDELIRFAKQTEIAREEQGREYTIALELLLATVSPEIGR